MKKFILLLIAIFLMNVTEAQFNHTSHYAFSPKYHITLSLGNYWYYSPYFYGDYHFYSPYSQYYFVGWSYSSPNFTFYNYPYFNTIYYYNYPYYRTYYSSPYYWYYSPYHYNYGYNHYNVWYHSSSYNHHNSPKQKHSNNSNTYYGPRTSGGNTNGTVGNRTKSNVPTRSVKPTNAAPKQQPVRTYNKAKGYTPPKQQPVRAYKRTKTYTPPRQPQQRTYKRTTVPNRTPTPQRRTPPNRTIKNR